MIESLFKDRRLKIVIFFAIIFIILLINSVHNSYPDEFDNILGGRLINLGFIPYRDFFSHHGILSYYLASFLTLAGGQSFVHFRILSVFFFLGTLVATYLILKKRTNNSDVNFFYLYITLLTISSTYFWGHMFLADNFSGYLLIPAYGLVFLKIFRNQLIETKDLVIISLFSALTSLNSTTFLYESIFISGITFLYYFNQKTKWKISKFTFKTLISFILIFASPYIIYILYLFVTGTWTNFYNEAYLYNKNYYIYNYPRAAGSTSFNPIRYAVVIIQNFINNYQILLSGILKFDPMNPYNVTLGATNLIIWSFLLFKKKFLLFFLSLFAIIFATVRNTPQSSNATDYQSSVYFLLTFFNTSFLLYFIPKEIENIKEHAYKIAFSIFFTILIFFWFFNSLFLFGNFERLAFDRYMGKMPLIYDRPQTANIINSVVPKDHYCWVGPWQFEEMFYLNCKLPSPYTWFLPQILNSQKMQQDVISDYSKNRADIIVYQRYFSAFFQSPAYNNFFIDGVLQKYYLQLPKVYPNRKLHFKGSPTKDFDLDQDFNFEKSKAEALVNKLIEKGYIEEKN